MQTYREPVRTSYRNRGRLRVVRGGSRRAGALQLGARVRVASYHSLEWRRGRVGEVLELFGGEEYAGAAVRFAGGEERMFWVQDLVEVG